MLDPQTVEATDVSTRQPSGPRTNLVTAAKALVPALACVAAGCTTMGMGTGQAVNQDLTANFNK